MARRAQPPSWGSLAPRCVRTAGSRVTQLAIMNPLARRERERMTAAMRGSLGLRCRSIHHVLTSGHVSFLTDISRSIHQSVSRVVD